MPLAALGAVAWLTPFEALIADGADRFWGFEFLSTLIVVFGLFVFDVALVELGMVIGTIMVPVGVPLVVFVEATLRASGVMILVIGMVVELADEHGGRLMVSVVVGLGLSVVFRLIVCNWVLGREDEDDEEEEEEATGGWLRLRIGVGVGADAGVVVVVVVVAVRVAV